MKTTKEQGIVLVALVFIVVILGAASYALIGIITPLNQAIREPADSAQALFNAEAGIQQGVKIAKKWLHDDVTPPDGYHYIFQGQSFGGGTIDLAKIEWDAEKLTSVFEATGYYQNSRRQLEVRLWPGSEDVLRPACPPGVFGESWAHVQETAYVDSYNSSDGVGWQGEGVEQNGDVGSNLAVTIDINATVYGDAYTFEPDGEVTVTGTVTGGTLNLDPEVDSWDLEPITIPAGVDYTQEGDLTPEGEPMIEGDAGKGEDYEITDETGDGTPDSFTLLINGVVSFNSGTYRFYDFTCMNNSSITAKGQCDIYVEHAIRFENNSDVLPPITLAGDATNFRFYYLGSIKVDISNNVTFYGYLYAPDATIEVRNNDSVFGALIGDSVKIWNGGAVHFDEALLSKTFNFIKSIPAPPLSVHWWREVI